MKLSTNIANQLVALWVRPANLLAQLAVNPCISRLLNRFVRQNQFVFLRGWRHFGGQFSLQRDRWLHHLVRPHHRIDDHLF